MRCLTSLNMKAFEGSLPVVTQLFGVLCLAWIFFWANGFHFLLFPCAIRELGHWHKGCRMCAETGTCSPQCVKWNPNCPVSEEVPPKLTDFPAPAGEHSPVSMLLPLLLPAPPRTQTPSEAQVRTEQTQPKHNFLLPARAFLEERDEEEQPTHDLSQAWLMQEQKVLK